MKNKRLMAIAEKAVRLDLGGGRYELDGYNQQVITNGISFAITTRTFGDNNHFLMEVYERGSANPPGDKHGLG